jgi:hypothetical protein
MESTIETTGATLREITGWTTIDFVGDDDSVVVHFGHNGRPYAMWTDASGIARELGRLTASELDTLGGREQDQMREEAQRQS